MTIDTATAIILANKDLLTIEELAIWLGKGWQKGTIYSHLPPQHIWMDKDKLRKYEEKGDVWIMKKHYFRVGSQFRISKSAIDSWMRGER